MYKKKQKHLKKFKKKFNTRIIKSKSTYSIEEITKVLGVNKSAVGRWFHFGLPKIDNQQPYLVWGQDLIDFLNIRNKSKKRPCGENQLFCCRCQKATCAKGNVVRIDANDKRINLIGVCVECGGVTNRTISPQKIEVFKKIFIFARLEQENLIECSNSSATATKN